MKEVKSLMFFLLLKSVVFFGQTKVNTDITSGLLLHLDAGNSSSYSGNGNTWSDLSPSGNNGTINGATFNSTNKSFDFDGTNDYVGLSAVLPQGQAVYTIEGYFKQDTQQTGVISEQSGNSGTNNGARMMALSDGYGGFNGRANDFHDNTPVKIGDWNYWTITVDKNAGSNQIKVYVNGILQSQGNTSNGANNLIGTSCGNNMTSAYYNQALGSSCLTSVTDGYNNIAIGHDSGLVVSTGNHNIYMGYKTIASSNSETNTILIGMGDGINNFSSGGSDNIRLGKRTSYIHTDNDSASFSTGSDERWKKNIADNSVGLDFINELRTVTYNWKKHSELDNTFSEYDATDADSPDDTKLKYGLIAQEVKTAMDTHSVNEKFEGWRADSSHPDGKQMVSNDAFVIPLIKAVQELTTRIKALEDA